MFYFHVNHSLSILEDLGISNTVSKDKLLEREQYYIDLLFKNFPYFSLNLALVAGSTLRSWYKTWYRIFYKKIWSA